MYSNWAHLYDDIYDTFKDYAAEAARIKELISERLPAARTLLDVACGTGKHLEALSPHYDGEGVDSEPQMLGVAKKRLPDVPLHHGDMRTFDLGRRFDVITCLFSAIGHLKSSGELNHAIDNMERHLNSPGLLIVEPWISPEDWNDDNPINATFVDKPDLKLVRMIHSQRRGRITRMETHFLVGKDRRIEHFDSEIEAFLFTDDEYTKAFERAGLKVEHDPEGLMGRGLFLGLKS